MPASPRLRYPKRVVAVTLAGCVALSSCAAPGNDPSLSAEENQLRQSHARFTQTVGEGAAVGAVAGAVAGALLGGRNRLQGAAIGAAAGGALGAGAGYLVARNNASRTHSESDYRSAIADAEQQSADLRKSADAARAISDRAVREIAALNAQYRSQQITASQFRSQVSKYQTDNQLIQQQAQDAEGNVSSLRTFANGSGQYRGQILSSANDMDASRTSIQRSAAAISQALSAVPAGA